MRIPRATYRFQFNKHFRLVDGLALVPYLHELGISHIYASPLFKASPGSLHGYDVCDFNQLNPEIGTEEDLKHLAQALHRKKMGLVVDIVPNHMGITSPENLWWWDALARGKKSKFAEHFDIHWKTADKQLEGKILAPILGGEYEAILKKGEFKVVFENGEFALGYHEHRFPLTSETAARLPRDEAGLTKLNADLGKLDQLIRKQHYQLAHYEQGDARLNYRRFFAVSTLAAVCVEREETFNATHGLLRRWLEEGLLDGVRVDHPDGLREPTKYLKRLRAIAPKAWIVVEKILELGEPLPRSWPVQGTTGYDFLNQLNGLFVDTAAEAAFTGFYASFTGERTDYSALVVEKKRDVLKTLLVAELNRLTNSLAMVAARNPTARQFSRTEMAEALSEIVACFPVYRPYISGDGAADAADLAAIKFAVQLACENRKDLPQEIFAFIHALLVTPRRGVAGRNFVGRFQQLTGAVMAKGVEDTVFYCFNRFISLNEVGGEPRKFGTSLDEFHKFLKQQELDWPHTQLATSTHDTKRAEDVRARLNVLTEIPELWEQAVRRWSAMNEPHRENNQPDRNAEYLIYQTLAGAWPLPEDRLQAYMEKATHEAKQHTDWTKPNQPYEQALKKFIAGILRSSEFTADLDKFCHHIGDAAAVNSLAQTLIKLTAPGVPDIYQGSELWDFSLVDPDNRRPVDFALRRNLIEAVGVFTAEKAWERRADGFAKMWLIHKALMCRADVHGFSGLGYEPIHARGARKDHVVAFSRDGRVMTVAPRLWLKLNGDWQDTALDLPPGRWQNELTGDFFESEIRMADLFQKFPVALLVPKEND